MATRVVQPPGGWVFDLPLIGDDFAKIGRAIDIYADPCKPTAEIWVYGFFQAIPTLFITLTKPELIDINIRHRGGKPRKGKKYRFKASALFRDALIEVPVPRWVVFRVYEWSQRIGWYFLVADALENFAINWMTLAYKYNGCQSPLLVYLTSDTVHRLQGSSGLPANRQITWVVTNVSNIGAGVGQAVLVLPGTYRVTWEFTFEPYQNPALSEMPYNMYLAVNGVPHTLGEFSDIGGGKRMATGSAIIEHGTGPNANLIWYGQWLTANKFCYADVYIDIGRREDNELEPDP